MVYGSTFTNISVNNLAESADGIMTTKPNWLSEHASKNPNVSRKQYLKIIYITGLMANFSTKITIG